MEKVAKNNIIYGLSIFFPCEIYFYDLKTKVCKCKILPLSKNIKGKVYEPKIPASCAMAENNCIISGGGHPDLPEYFKTTVLCRITPIGEWDFLIKQVEDMKIPKAEHSLLAISSDLYLSVGGINQEELLGACEAYSLSQNSWIPYSPLCQPRKQTSLCLFDNSVVFAFGGKNAKELPLASIERLKLGNPKNVWRSMLLLSGVIFPPLSSSFVVQIKENTIFIAGGTSYEIDPKIEKKAESTMVPLIELKKSWYLDTKTLQFSNGPELTIPSEFSVGQPVLSQGIAGGMDALMNIHIFSLDKLEWMCIREAHWNTFKYQLKAGSEMAKFL